MVKEKKSKQASAVKSEIIKGEAVLLLRMLHGNFLFTKALGRG